jgi:hypothetical protein
MDEHETEDDDDDYQADFSGLRSLLAQNEQDEVKEQQQQRLAARRSRMSFEANTSSNSNNNSSNNISAPASPQAKKPKREVENAQDPEAILLTQQQPLMLNEGDYSFTFRFPFFLFN